MSILVALALVGAILAVIAIFRSADNLAAWAALAIAGGIILEYVR